MSKSLQETSRLYLDINLFIYFLEENTLFSDWFIGFMGTTKNYSSKFLEVSRQTVYPDYSFLNEKRILISSETMDVLVLSEDELVISGL